MNCMAQTPSKVQAGNVITEVTKATVYTVTGAVNVSNAAVPFSEAVYAQSNYQGNHTVAVQMLTQNKMENQKQQVEITNAVTSGFPLQPVEKKIHVVEMDNVQSKSSHSKSEIVRAAVKVE